MSEPMRSLDGRTDSLDLTDGEPAEPTAADVAEIEADWPVLAAEVAVVTAECQLAAWPSELAVRRHRRAVARLDSVVRLRRQARRPERVNVVALRPRSPFLAVVPTTPAAA